jgi:hypothetical protein
MKKRARPEREPSTRFGEMLDRAIIARMVRLHLDTFGYAASELAKLLHIYERQVSEFYDLSASPAPVVPGLRLRVVR